MNKLLLVVLICVLSLTSSVHAQDTGEALFQSTCIACHTIGEGRLIGPDLSGVYERREMAWLIEFIRSSQKMIKGGDSLAVALFEEYGKIPMPDNNFGDDEILSILDYIKEVDLALSNEQSSNVSAQDKPVQTITISYPPELVEKGKSLFYGYEKFSNGASSCNACHFIQDESIIGGGKLSLDLTKSFERLGEPGIKAILTNPPFPEMSIALRNKSLTDDEKEAITAMLQFANNHYGNAPNRLHDGLIFIVLSFVCAMFFLVYLYLFFDYRKIPKA
jgi:cytochrome c551/c552